MSGIVGMIDRSGAPIERTLLHALTHFLTYRGPDDREVWADGAFGFGHAMLRTTCESAGERQPASLEGKWWITADARIDCRGELVAELEATGRDLRRVAPDSELILHAYAAWGGDCVEHLRGDFAFAIWDSRTRTVFCARDHFGVKPFYYAELGSLFLFSNTLDCVRLHPDISEELDEAAIADFLLFGLNCNDGTTTFRDVRRLPPAHTLTASADGIQIRRYWSPPTDGRIRYRHSDEYVEHFQILLRSAVADRMRTNRVGILLSGGIDSASIATTAHDLSRMSGGTAELRAYTIVNDSAVADRDGVHARKLAEFLQIPIRCLAVDDLRLFERWNDPEWSWPEPVDDPFFAGLFDQFQMIAADCRVALTGEGSDNLMHFEIIPYAKDLARRRDWKRLFSEMPRYLLMRPSPMPGLRRRMKGYFGKDPTAPEFPKWLAPDFQRRMDLKSRWNEWSELRAPVGHPILPSAHASLTLPHWSHLFEHENPGVTRCPVEVRHPFLDLRIVNYLLALPPYPWFFEKKLLREAMVGRMPESVRARPKTPVANDPLVEQLKRPATEWGNQVVWTEEVEQYVELSALEPLNGEKVSEKVNSLIRPTCLNFGLHSARRVRYNLHAEAGNG